MERTGLPLTLINQAKQALLYGDTYAMIQELNDENLADIDETGSGFLREYSNHRSCAKFQYEGQFYLIANYEDYQTAVIKAVGFFHLNGENSREAIYMRKIAAGYPYDLLYKNEKNPLTEAVKSYVDSIGIDLIYTDRTHGTFHGDETQRDDMLETVQKADKENDLMLWNIYDNDGRDDFFDRKIRYNGGDMPESLVRWHDMNTHAIQPAPVETWNPKQYFLTQT